MQVNEIPSIYNGTVCFELPATFGNQKRMYGMEQKFDGHFWTRPAQSNMAVQCTVHLSYCLGHLMCHRVTCAHYLNEKKFNDTYFHGHLDKHINKGYLAIEEKSKIICHYYQ